ncbi:MAG TPA: hypothetical protein VFV75_05170 [Candidatus Polarisedimenticolaceae bacterium]|nr:hypothetical protein [Candidatus Polarisedimenticolaceae bacterium]
MVTLLLLAAAALAPRTSAPPALPPPALAAPEARDCDAEVPGNQYNDRIDCRAQNVHAAAFAYVDSVLEHDRIRRALGGDPIFNDTQTDHLLAARERARTAKDRTHEAKGFQGSVKKQKAQDADCYVKEILGDGGPHGGDDVQPCTQGEDCEEVIGDDIGDDDGICKLRGNNREVCVTVCQQPLPSDEDEYDPDFTVETEKGLDELEVALNDATEEVRKSTRRMLAMFAARPTGQPLTACEQYQFDQFPGYAFMQVSQVVKNISNAATDGCGVVCDQDAFGWNCKGACLVFVIVDGIVNSVYDGFALKDDDNGSNQLDAVARCTTELSADIASVSGAVGGTQASLDEVNLRLDAIEASLAALDASMRQRFDGVDLQLCTPQGQRTCFPAQSGSERDASDPTAGKGRRPSLTR